MKTLIGTVLAGVFMVTAAVAQTPPLATALDSLRWDYEDARLTSDSVVRFEVCFDAQSGAGCTNVTPAAGEFPPTPDQGGAPAAGFSAYRVRLPALTVGDHVVRVRACNTDLCSDPLALTFRFGIQPVVPVNGRFIRGTES